MIASWPGGAGRGPVRESHSRVLRSRGDNHSLCLSASGSYSYPGFLLRQSETTSLAASVHTHHTPLEPIFVFRCRAEGTVGYSYLNATIGSRREALRAGHMPKNSPTLTATTKPVITLQTGTVVGMLGNR